MKAGAPQGDITCPEVHDGIESLWRICIQRKTKQGPHLLEPDPYKHTLRQAVVRLLLATDDNSRQRRGGVGQQQPCVAVLFVALFLFLESALPFESQEFQARNIPPPAITPPLS